VDWRWNWTLPAIHEEGSIETVAIQGTALQTTLEKATRHRFFIVTILFIGIMVAYLDRVNVSILAANERFLIDMGIKGQPIKIGMMMSAFLAIYGIANLVLSPLGDL
jgi:sugar phosphate permease